jgi:DNA-binding Lrp family transcriptional regulator
MAPQGARRVIDRTPSSTYQKSEQMKRKVDLKKLEALSRIGMSVTAMAKELGVSPGTISNNTRLLDSAKAKDVALRCAAEINDRKIDAMAQLTDLNKRILLELGRIETELEDAPQEGRGDLRDHQRKHAGEIRKQINTFLEIAKTLYNWEEVLQFQQTVLEVIGEIDGEVRTRILEALKQRRNARSALKLGEPGI